MNKRVLGRRRDFPTSASRMQSNAKQEDQGTERRGQARCAGDAPGEIEWEVGRSFAGHEKNLRKVRMSRCGRQRSRCGRSVNWPRAQPPCIAAWAAPKRGATAGTANRETRISTPVTTAA